MILSPQKFSQTNIESKIRLFLLNGNVICSELPLMYRLLCNDLKFFCNVYDDDNFGDIEVNLNI